MTPVKNQGFSHCKGKEVVSNDPTARGVGEEAAYSESDRFDKEKARRNPDSDCAPFIDPWYDTHAHFPKVHSEYMPPQHGHILGSVGFFDSRSCYPPRYFTPRAHSLRVWIGYCFRLEGMGRQRVVRHEFYGGATVG